jgi:hypothetical protein
VNHLAHPIQRVIAQSLERPPNGDFSPLAPLIAEKGTASFTAHAETP